MILFRALREVWPNSLETFNLVEPSQSMQRAGQSLIKGMDFDSSSTVLFWLLLTWHTHTIQNQESNNFHIFMWFRFEEFATHTELW